MLKLLFSLMILVLGMPAVTAHADSESIACAFGGGTGDLVTELLSSVTTTTACSLSGNPQSVQSARIINEAFDAVESDLAQGKGEYLQALNSIMACEYATQNIRQDYANYVLSEDYLIANLADKKQHLSDMVNQYLISDRCAA